MESALPKHLALTVIKGLDILNRHFDKLGEIHVSHVSHFSWMMKNKQINKQTRDKALAAMTQLN